MIRINVGNLRKDPGYGRAYVDVHRYDDRGSAYPVIECSVLLYEGELHPGATHCCTSTFPPSLSDYSTVRHRVRGFIERHDSAIRDLLS
jgi:hypothetical protein